MIAHKLKKSPILERYGPVAFVTGASSGIGRELAKELANQGFDLILTGRNTQELESCAAWSRAKGVQVQVIASDLTDESHLQNLLDMTRDLSIGLVVASAGFGTSGPFESSSVARERDMLAVNCEAVLRLTHHFIGNFKERGRGGIILLSSIVAFQGAPYSAHYAATKAYVQSLAEGLYHELKPHRIDVLASAPGPTMSSFGARAGLTMTKAQSPITVAKETLAALGKGPTVRPGALSKLLGYSLTTLPRWARVRLMSKLMQDMLAGPVD